MIRKIFLLCLAMGLTAPQISFAGPYSDDLSKCLVGSSSEDEKQDLVQWMFFTIALNPDAAPFANISVAQREGSDKKMARLFERMLTEACLTEAKNAIKYEGKGAVGDSFKLLGEVAVAEIFAAPAVSAGVATFTKHLDVERIGKALSMGEAGK